ncbi:MAG TPA: TrbI/VirB10 family protein [Stellaceae bacterium]|nr:TrbI/VirB10 family protein [Stellaceae bacterium]
MSEFHANDEWDEDEEPEPLPIWRRRKWLVIGLGVVVLLAFLFTRGKPHYAQDAPKAPESYIGVVVPYQAAKTEATAASPPTSTAVAPAPPMMPALRGQLPGASGSPVRPAMLSYVVPHSDGPKPAASPPADPPQTGLAFKAASLPGVKASPAIDDTYQLMPGLLPCVLDTAIEADLPGPLLCHLPGPVYSPKGVLLMEAETQVIGRYESLKTNAGNRLLAVSTYAHTPNGIWVPLADEPLADDLGRTGFDGSVDNHYLARFGGAVILSLTESGLGILQAAVAKGGNTYISTGSANNLAEQILQAQINIPSTFSKHQGETIAIWLTTPIDFSDSYKLRQVRK